MDFARVISGSQCSTASWRPYVERCRPILRSCRAMRRSGTASHSQGENRVWRVYGQMSDIERSQEDARDVSLTTAYSIRDWQTSPILKGFAALVTVIGLQAVVSSPGHAAETLPADVLRSWLVRFRPLMRSFFVIEYILSCIGRTSGYLSKLESCVHRL